MAIDLREEIHNRRLERMRLGQAVCAPEQLPSDPEIQVALVPLSGAERLNATAAASLIDVGENVAGLMARDHRQKVEILACAIRDPKDLNVRLYRDGDDLQHVDTGLQETDIDHLYDCYLEMIDNSSPAVDGIPPQEFEALKKAFGEMDMSALSGRSWYALKRFLGVAIPDGLLTDSSLGSTSNMKLTTTKE